MKEVSSLAAGAMSSRSAVRAEARSLMYERWRLPALKFITMFGKPITWQDPRTSDSRGGRQSVRLRPMVRRARARDFASALIHRPATNSKDSTDVPSSSMASDTA